MSQVMSQVMSQATGLAPPDRRSTATELDRFAEALEARRMGPRLAAAVGAPSPTCHVLDAKYEPGVRGILLYDLGGRLLRGDLAAASGSDGEDGQVVVAPGVRVSEFPHDPELPSLPVLIDAARLGRALHGHLPPPTGCRTSLLRYRPGKRATVLLQGSGAEYVVKAYHDPHKAAAVADEASRLDSAGCGASVRFAPTVAHVPDLALVVQRRVSGRPLDVLLRPEASGPSTRSAVRRAARALADFHQAAPVTRRQRPVEREVRRFGERAARIATVAPETGAVLARLAERLATSHQALPAARPGPVHGDCKPSQFLLGDRHVVLLDLDHVGLSDQATDVGTFLASLQQRDVRRSLAAGGSRAEPAGDGLAAVFLDTYLACRGDEAERLRARWHTAAALERKALRAFARAPRSPVAVALAQQADRCLDRLRKEA
jgi:hypothetical protein